MTLTEIKKNIRQTIKELEENQQGGPFTKIGCITSIGLLKEAIADINYGIKMDKETKPTNNSYYIGLEERLSKLK
tara:strand:- start:54 stop:278 length:225 start_codon:yes stop_codon:yes gene_type:complete